MVAKKKYKFLKIIALVMIVLVATGSILSYRLSLYYTKLVKTHLPEWISKATNGTYRVSVNDVSLSIWRQHITLHDLRLWPDTERIHQLLKEAHPPTTLFTVYIPDVEISNVHFLRILFKKEISCGQLMLFHPKAIILSEARLKDSLKKETPDTLEMNKENKSPAIRSLHADKIRVISPDVGYLFAGDKDSFYCDMKNGEATLYDWTFDHNTERDTDRFLYASSCKINFGQIKYRSRKDGWHYTAKTAALNFSSQENRLELNNFSFSADLYGTIRDNTILRERDSFYCPVATLHEFHWKQLMNNELFLGDILKLSRPVLDCYMHPTKSGNNTRHRYPQQFFQQVKLKIGVKTVAIHDGLIRYTELNPRINRSGVILFTNVQGSLEHVSNIRTNIAKHKDCIARLRGRYKDHGEINTVFYLYLGDTLGKFKIDATAKGIEAEQIQTEATVLSQLDIRSGHLDNTTIHLEGDQDSCKGNITMLYNNLNIEIQKITLFKKMRRRILLSLVAKNLFLYPDNPMKNKEERKASMFLKRKSEPFFNLIWSTVSDGVQKTVIHGEIERLRKPGPVKKLLHAIIK